jgi:hypothetical protein
MRETVSAAAIVRSPKTGRSIRFFLGRHRLSIPKVFAFSFGIFSLLLLAGLPTRAVNHIVSTPVREPSR